ncbi:MAG: hypothetical protein Kow001_03470 [Acidobacteriota bacterium]
MVTGSGRNMLLASDLLSLRLNMVPNHYPRKLGWLIAALLLLSGYAKGQEQRGADIHFRGPVFGMTRDLQGEPRSLIIQVNRSQIEVQVNQWTEVVAGRGFRALPRHIRLGAFLEVDGFFTSAGRIVAKRIHIEGSAPLELEGTLDWVAQNAIRVSGITVLLDENTIIRRSGGGQLAAAELLVGEPVRLRAEDQQGLWVGLEVEVGYRTVESEPLRLEGRLVKVDNQLLSVDVGVSGVSALVAFDQTTQFSGPLRVGLMIEIEGRFLPGTALIKAARVAVDTNENSNVFDDLEGLTSPPAAIVLKGLIAGLRKTSTRMEFRITETQVIVDVRTRVVREGQVVSPSELSDGLLVEVSGQRSNGVVLADEVRILDDDSPTPGDDDGSGKGDEAEAAEVEGVITDLLRSQDLSVVMMTVEGKRIHLNQQTVIEDPHGPVPSRVLELGQKVEVKGVWRQDGSILAKKIKIEG